ncbi:zinc ABC transporter substrate-binding protein [Klugiella xanthotipulae]|uniref:Zinc/manganese transport system substrate-binding protein/manganese/iron transport system substrate-binding protein n=2 Tax=Klugiella xanthotipulae TaxID=244735 RepID=A0A543I6Y5_9MICO|nr:zinc/manganese transport system substrate-binding protein/manganese/iron transport system substrate-binding protein [Klugiella xanthotipulae]
MKRASLLTALTLTAVLSATGCSATTAPNPSPASSLAVVATTTQVGDFTANVGGDLIALTQLLTPGASAHHFDPTPADLATLADADVLVINGAGLEGFLDSAIEASGFDGITIDSSTGIALSGGEDHAEAAESEGAPERATGEAKGNPHVWTDPALAEKMVITIASGLAKADPAHASAFEANATAYNAKLAELDTWVRTNVNAVPAEKRLVVSNHDAFHYFLDAYDITFVGSIIPSFEDNAEPSAAEIDALVAKITKLGVRAIFSESSVSDKTAAAIAQAAGVTVYSGEDALFGDSLGAAGSGGETYISATIHNATVIMESWGITPTPVPAGLE